MNIIEQELVALRGQRVRIHKAIEHMQRRVAFEPQRLYGPDGHYNTIAELQAQFRGTERRWTELHLMLGRRVPGPAVRLGAPSRSAPVRRAGARSAPGYMTKVLTAG